MNDIYIERYPLEQTEFDAFIHTAKKPIDGASGYGILLDRLFRVNLTGKFAYCSHLNRVRD